MSAGYRHPAYAASFASIGEPRHLVGSGGWILERTIPESSARDAMGLYPLFVCSDWSRLPGDLSELADRLVSLTLVAEPFGTYDEALLRSAFDVVRVHKQHYVADLEDPKSMHVPRDRRRSVAKARRRIDVEVCSQPADHLDEWLELYAELRIRHSITGIPAFSREAFAHQLTVPGLVMLRATADGQVVGMYLWYVDGEFAYSHLSATSALGYELRASYALYDSAVEYLRGRTRWLDFGSAPGAEDSERGAGLRLFKRGWSTTTRPVFLCGRIFQPEAYAELVRARECDGVSYFPAYRAAEFS